MKKALRRRKARAVGRKFIKAFRKQGISHACIDAKAPRWYFASDLTASRKDRLDRMGVKAGDYIYDATGRNYAIDVVEDISGKVCIEATLLPSHFPIAPVFTPLPRSRS